jgi:iron-sulfur cluster assembly accessory protein
MNDVISMSPEAVAKVAALRNAEAGAESFALRVGVRSGGCSGFRYELFFDAERADDDLVLSFPADPTPLEVVLDPESAKLLAGATLEYQDGLTGAGFKITNPNATRRCGCNQSFGV